jgi:methionine-rich copper-binding protein CopC
MSAKNARLIDCRDDMEGPDLDFMHVQKVDGLDPHHVARPDKIDHVLELFSVSWQVVSVDTHTTQGTFTFTVS